MQIYLLAIMSDLISKHRNGAWKVNHEYIDEVKGERHISESSWCDNDDEPQHEHTCVSHQGNG